MHENAIVGHYFLELRLGVVIELNKLWITIFKNCL